MTITPDTKDWTWVLDRPCPECGFTASSVDRGAIADVLRDNAAQWERVLGRADVRDRPSPQVWSPLEYACHVRDVLLKFDERLRLMLADDDPPFANWDQDQSALEGRYGEQDPAAVAVALRRAAETLAAGYAVVRDDQWQRPGTRSNGSRFTVESLGRYLLHDVVHHIDDVERD
jgi:hypothetical protein